MIHHFVDFIRTKYETNDFIPLHKPKFLGKEKEFLSECIDEAKVSSYGRFIDSFEDSMAKVTKTNKALSLVNGTAALQVALKLAGVKQGHEVITQSLTFVATANAISYNGAHPIFLDVDRDTMGLSPDSVKNFLEKNGELREDGCYNKSTGRRISACVPMHTFGFPVHLDELVQLCKKWSIPIVEDSAESLGSLYKGQPTGSFGLLGVFSMNGNKIITSGGGGVIVSQDSKLIDHGKYLISTAKERNTYEFIHNEIGYNYVMPNLNAALAFAQLQNLDYLLKTKRELAAEYESFFRDTSGTFRTELPSTRANYWLMSVEFNSKNERDVFLKFTNDANIETRPIWKPMHTLPMYQHCQRDDQNNTEFLADRIVNIPSSAV